MNPIFECLYVAESKELGGLAWTGSGMLFADLGASMIRCFNPDTGKTDIWRRYTNRTNGIAFGPDGALYAAQESGRRVVRLLEDGSSRPTCSVLDGRYQNHPTFVAVDPAGSVWISDCFSVHPAAGPQIFPMQDCESVLRLRRSPQRPAGWCLERMVSGIEFPRGIAVSPAGDRLYVASALKGGNAGELCAYLIDEHGALGPKSVPYRADTAIHGLCVDDAGRVLACLDRLHGTTAGGIAIIDCEGAREDLWGVPGYTPIQCAFGGPANDELYVTTRQGALLRAVGMRGSIDARER